MDRQRERAREPEAEDVEMNLTPEERRESGRPGGGHGRRDEVGHTGVYPMSGPEMPPGEAVLRGQAEWGQGERGAAGYEDHGDSEITTFDFWEEVERGGVRSPEERKRDNTMRTQGRNPNDER